MSASRSDYLTFVAGLNTEGGFFTQPPNTWKEGDNVVPNIDGSLSRRKGIDYEQSYLLSTGTFPYSSASNFAYATSSWKNAGNVAGRTFYVIQVGNYVWFYANEGLALSQHKHVYELDLTAYRVAGTPYSIGSQEIHTANVDGAFLLVAKDIDPLYIEYDGTTFSITALTIKIRDFKGVDDGLKVNEKPLTLTMEHFYNLLNQGWTETKITNYAGTVGITNTSTTGYPSNAQMWTYGKNSSDNFDKAVLNKVDFGSSYAPRGRFILNAFYQDRNLSVSDPSTEYKTFFSLLPSFSENIEGRTPTLVSVVLGAISGLEIFEEVTRPSTCAFFAGRAWYAGSEGIMSNAVFFSRIGEKASDYEECYQVADPTSEVLSDLVETDGGVIYIKEADNIHYLLPMFDGMLVFADNGVWQITGTSQGGFNATGYAVYRVSAVGSVGPQSIVQVENSAFYWNSGGIYKLQPDPQSPGILVSVPVTDMNIKTFFLSIPILSKRYAKGTYNMSTKQIVWMYSCGQVAADGWEHLKNRVLTLDLRLGAFYTASLSCDANNLPVVVSHLVTEASTRASSEYTVLDSNGDSVLDSNDDAVVADVVGFSPTDVVEKYLTLHPSAVGVTYKVVFSDFYNDYVAPDKFLDWYSVDSVGTNFNSYFITGYDVGTASPSNKKYPLYCTVFMKSTEEGFTVGGDAINESSCLMQSRWDFTNTSSSGKWSTEQQVYRKSRPLFISSTTDEDGHPLVITKNKIRGSGKAVQFKFTAEEGKDMQIVGWQVLLINNDKT